MGKPRVGGPSGSPPFLECRGGIETNIERTTARPSLEIERQIWKSALANNDPRPSTGTYFLPRLQGDRTKDLVVPHSVYSRTPVLFLNLCPKIAPEWFHFKLGKIG